MEANQQIALQQNAAPAGQAADPLTIAYLAIGAEAALAERNGPDLDAFGGHMGFIEKVTDIAAPMDAACDALMRKHDEIGGVWCYEVAEPVGRKFAEQLLQRVEADWVPIFVAAVASCMQISTEEAAQGAGLIERAEAVSPRSAATSA